MERIYTTEQIKSGNYDIQEVFGCVVPNPLPFRLLGFHETSTDGQYTAFRYSGDTLQDCLEMRRFCEGPLLGIYELGENQQWKLVPNSWDRMAKFSCQ